MHKAKSIFIAAFLAVGMLSMSLLSLGQSTAGSINGVVKDPGGAVMPGVSVTLLNLGTGRKLQTITSPQGTYNFRNLPVGNYSVQAQIRGFAIQEKTGLELFANQAVTADIDMKVSGSESRIEVSAAPSLIDTQNSHLSNVITGSSLLKMSILSRQGGATGIYGMLYFSPGAQNTSSGSVNQGQGNTSGTPTMNGNRQLDTMVTMDGMVVMENVDDLGGGPIQPSEEAIQEIHTVMSTAPAEFWRSAAVTVVSKSGTNQVHGSLFEDYNGTVLNSKNFFATSVPSRVENNFAASIGGPIKKDKLFYYGVYEGGRNAQAAVIVANTPLPAWRTGNFSSLSQPIINPYTGSPFQNNQIPANMISPVATSIQAAIYPLPNYGGAGLLSGNYRSLLPQYGVGYATFNQGDISLDYIAGKKDTVFLHDSYRKLPAYALAGQLPTVGRVSRNRVGATGVINEDHIFSPTLINEFRFGYNYHKLGLTPSFNGYDLLIKAGMQGPFTAYPVNFLDVPRISINSITGTTGAPAANSSTIGYDYEWNDNLSWTLGKHLLKFGVDQILDHIHRINVPGTVYGTYSFNGGFTKNAYADFLLGLPQQTSINAPAPAYQLHGVLLGVYAQDQFQVNQRLTLNYGLRWEYQGPYSGAPYLMYSFNPKNGKEVIQTQAGLSHISPNFPINVVGVETAADAGYPSGSFLFSHYLNFYPRMGFAYRLFRNRGTIVRGAYGLYGNNIYGDETLTVGNGGPFVGSAKFINKFNNGSPSFSFPEPFLSGGTLATQTAQANDPNITVPYTQQWNLSFQQPLGSSTVVTASYVGSTTRNILVSFNLNQPPPSKTPFSSSELAYPNYNSVNWTVNAGVDNYNSVQLSLRESKGRNLVVDTGLTFAKDLTDAPDTGDYQGYPPEDRFCMGCEYGRNGLTRRVNYYINGSYMLPFGRGQQLLTGVNRWENGVIGGWGISGDALMMSGQFFTPYVNSGFDTANTNTSFNQRPDQIGNPGVSNRGIQNWFNIDAFAIPGCPTSDPRCTHSTPINVGRFGTVKPGSLVGPDFFRVDLSLMKDFHVTNRANFQFRITAQNALNHPNFDIPDWNVTDGPGVAGRITSLASAGLGPREIDIMGRFQF